MDQSVREALSKQVHDKFPGAVLQEDLFDFYTLTLNKQRMHAVVEFLQTDSQWRFGYLTTLCGLHYPDQKEELGLMMQLHSLEKNYRIRLKTFFTKEQATLPTFTTLFPAANWMEREAWDFFGIHFSGHPDLRRILNVEDMLIHPLRKEYPLEDQVRLDKNDTMFGR